MRYTLFAFLFAALTIGAACSDCPAGPDASSFLDATTDLGTADGNLDANPEDAETDADAPQTAAELNARFLVINQRVFREDDFFARGGLAVFELYEPQGLPADDRPEYFNENGERCTLESGTEWPTSLADGSSWPAGPFRDAGDLTLSVTTAPGNVVYSYFDTYYLRAAPDPVRFEGGTHNSFFPPEFIPHGQPAAISAPGGDDAPAFSIDGLSLAADYVVSSPQLEAGGDLIDNSKPLTVSWTPGDKNDRMVVIVKSGFNYISCHFEDDGEGVVPVEAMGMVGAGQFATFTIQTWREKTDKRRVTAADGTAIDLTFTSRHVQIGRFDGI